MVHLAEVARRVVALGYAPSMTGDRVAKLAATDPDWPIASYQERRVGNRRMVPWEPVRAYFAARFAGRGSRPGQKGWARRKAEWVTLAEVARRVVAELGYDSMSRQRVWELANTDPAWPVPRAQWRRVGRSWEVPWPPVRDFFANRDTHRGNKGRLRPPRDPRSSETDWVTWPEVARRVVAELGYDSMSRQTVGKLARTDPAWPVPRAWWRRVGASWEVPWPPVRDFFANRDTRPGPKGRPRSRRGPGSSEAEWVTLAEVAQRVVAELGYDSMSGQTVGKLANTDPAWPVPRAWWRRVGRSWEVPWPPVRAYFANRQPRRDATSRPRRDPAPSTASRASRSADSPGPDQVRQREGCGA
jgi:hypothetical protein